MSKFDLLTGTLTVLAISSKNWKAVYAASVLDGAAVFVKHWKGEVND